jgi:chemotaxis protein histidine kinase CheA
MIKIVISDDGRGINIEKLKEKISKKYPEQDVTNLSKNEIYQFIFKDQISTMDKVSETSGRGVGMSAVKSELDKINGKIEIKSNMGVGTTFIFMIPNS